MNESVQRVFSGAPWEESVGYCRALRTGNHVFVTGTAPLNPDGTVCAPGDAMKQTECCFAIIDRALHELGAKRTDIVRTRLFVTDISRSVEYGRAHRSYMQDHRPCATMVEVRALIDPEMLIEIEVDAVVQTG